MFEQVSTEGAGLLKRPLALTISLAGQAAVATGAVLVSLIYTDSLPRPFFLGPLVAPGPPARHRPAVKTSPALRTAKTPWHVFTAPALIPASVDNSKAVDTLPPIDDGGAIDAPGVFGGIWTTSPMALTAGDVLRPPAPPAQTLERPLEKQAASIPTRPVAVSQGVQAAKLIRQVNPAYPTLARQARVSGTVRLTAIIGRDGAIRNLEVMSGHPLLASAALEAVRQWLYQPTLLNREPVEVTTQIDVNFTLSR